MVLNPWKAIRDYKEQLRVANQSLEEATVALAHSEKLDSEIIKLKAEIASYIQENTRLINDLISKNGLILKQRGEIDCLSSLLAHNRAWLRSGHEHTSKLLNTIDNLRLVSDQRELWAIKLSNELTRLREANNG